MFLNNPRICEEKAFWVSVYIYIYISPSLLFNRWDVVELIWLNLKKITKNMIFSFNEVLFVL